MKTRRELLIACGCALATPLASFAQPAPKTARIGILWSSSPDATGYLSTIFKDAMRELGWIEKRNVEYFERYALGDLRRCEGLAAELVAEKVQLIKTSNADVAREAAKAAPGLPIVFGTGADPVGAGIVASLARPGGNITGFSTSNAELGAKRIELLKEIRPQLKRVAMLLSPTASGDVSARPTADAARTLGLEFEAIKVGRADELKAAFETLVRWKADGLVITASPLFVNEYRQIVDQAARIRVPVVYARSDFVTRGGLMSYAADFADNHRRAAGYVDRILKGTKPADLPVQQPIKFELVINMKAAKALGLTIPQTILVRTDRVIE